MPLHRAQTLSTFRDIDNVAAFRCTADQTHMSATPLHEVGFSFHINSEVSCHTSVPSNIILNSFRRSETTGTSISTRSQWNDGITGRMFHRAMVRPPSRHYQIGVSQAAILGSEFFFSWTAFVQLTVAGWGHERSM